jgi:hypothetical protein
MIFSRSKSFVRVFLLFGQLTDHNELLSLKKRLPPGEHGFDNDVSNGNNNDDDDEARRGERRRGHDY